MDRRQFLSVAGGVLIAGCGGSDGTASSTTTTPASTPTSTLIRTPTPSPTSTPTDTSTQEPTATPEPASFAISTPLTPAIERGDRWSVTFTVTNEGGQSGVFNSKLEAKPGVLWEDLDTIRIQLAPGESYTYEETYASFNTTGEVPLRLFGTDTRWQLEISPKPKAEFEVVEFSVPNEVEIGQAVEATLRIENTGGKNGEFTSAISVKTPSSEWRQLQDTLSLQVNASQEASTDYTVGPVNYMTTLQVRLDERDLVESTDIVTRTLDFGDSYSTPTDVELTAQDVTFTSEYSYSSGRYDYTHTPADGFKWALVDFRAENNSGQPADLPTKFGIAVLIGDRQYDFVPYRRETEEYAGGEVQAGVVREGKILYEVPDDTARREAEIAWSQSYRRGDVAVRWST